MRPLTPAEIRKIPETPEKAKSVDPPSTTRKLLLTVEEVAYALGLGRTYVYALVMRREIRSLKVGRKRRIPVAALDEFVTRLQSGVSADT